MSSLLEQALCCEESWGGEGRKSQVWKQMAVVSKDGSGHIY